LPSEITISSDYHLKEGKVHDIVFKTLCEDCFNKCYICEEKPKDPQIEHRISHLGDFKLKYDWNNLLLSCSYCNNIKKAKCDNDEIPILNPLQCDPEEHIVFSIGTANDDIKSLVRIEALKTDESTLKTAKLLEFVYNGGVSPKKDLGLTHFLKPLMDNIELFKQYIVNHHKEPDEGYDEDIREEINRSSAFAAFKRKIVRDDPKLSVEFADALK